jgi:alpha-galactosidase
MVARLRFGFALSLLLSLTPLARAGDGLALTPPMGWNSWNKFACNVSEKLIQAAADALVASGMKDAGYQYIVIDDCWQVRRDAAGKIVPDPERFPSGIKALADAIHARGLKFGMYSDAGSMTCGKRPGSKGHESQDAKTYAEWGVDYLKYDWCNTEGMDPRDAYARMSHALRATGRPIVFSICEWGNSKPWIWAPGLGHLWRATGDIQDCWDCGASWGGMGVVHIIDLMADLYPFSGPGHWNDPDMLEVGNSGLSLTESRSHFSFWALFAAPLMAGNDLQTMKPAIRDILLNREVIAVDQDPLGMQGRKVHDGGAHEVWMKSLADGSRAVILFNRGSEEASIAAPWEDIGLFPGGKALVRDLWKKADLGSFTGRFEAKVQPHGVVMLKITPQD